MKKQTLKYLTITTLALVTLAGINGCAAHAEEIEASVNIHPKLTVSIPSTPVRLTLNPNAYDNGDYDDTGLWVTVSTNNHTGYYMTMDSDTTKLINTQNAAYYMETISEPASSAYSMETNRWGYRAGSSDTYIPFVPGAQVASSDESVNNSNVYINFGTRAGATMAPGIYEIELNFVAVTNPLPTYIQDLDPTLCTENPLVVVDNRDNQEYTIQRLADGNCWMMNNLNLGATDDIAPLNKYNTNIKDSVSADDFSTWRKSSASGSYTSPEYMPVDGTDSTSGTEYGTLYNYCAVTAGTYCMDPADNTDVNATQDICPAGWRLPKSGQTYDPANEFAKLSSLYEGDKMFAHVSEGGAAFAHAGYFDFTQPQNVGSVGAYWSSTRYGSEAMYYMYLSDSVAPANSTARYRAHSVRCVLKDNDTPTMGYLQDATAEMFADTPVEAASIYIDKRDNEEYRVAKLKDGNIWMLDNLRLDPTTVSLETLKGQTNATDESLAYLKNTITSNWTSETGDSYEAPYIYTGLKNIAGSTSFYDDNGTIITTAGKKGVYYNYCAASAGSYCYDSETNPGDASYDVCPSGWRLPTSAEFTAARSAYTSGFTAYNMAMNIFTTGSFSEGTIYNDSSAYFWTSTSGSMYSPKYMTVLDMQDAWMFCTNRDYGYSIRCVLKS